MGWTLMWIQKSAWRCHRAWQESSGLVSAGGSGSGQDQQGSYNRRQLGGDVAFHGEQRMGGVGRVGGVEDGVWEWEGEWEREVGDDGGGGCVGCGGKRVRDVRIRAGMRVRN